MRLFYGTWSHLRYYRERHEDNWDVIARHEYIWDIIARDMKTFEVLSRWRRPRRYCDPVLRRIWFRCITSQESGPFKCSECWPILPTYTTEGFITWEIIQSSFTAETFKSFIENKILPLCNSFPLPRSVIIMDNAPIHQSKVHLIYLKSINNRVFKNYAIMRV